MQKVHKLIVYSSAYDNEAKQNVVIKKLIRAFENEVTAKHAYREYSILKFVDHCNVSDFLFKEEEERGDWGFRQKAIRRRLAVF